jgi:TAT (twin-arginine translocation) pathway signal sequence
MRNVNDQSAEAHRYRISRRTFLRGAGVVMALPLLESLPVWGVDSAAAPPRVPRRFAAVFMGNGINLNHWWAKVSGAGMELSKTLEPQPEDQFRRRSKAR